MSLNKKLTIYVVRHAEAEHNVWEKSAIHRAIQDGLDEKEQEVARRKSLENLPSNLKDAPLSQSGFREARHVSCDLDDGIFSAKDGRYQPPKVVLVSPLRRALMTATLLFYHPNSNDNPQFIAMEALREKRTGLACDERTDAATLQKEFPHVNFDNIANSDDIDPKSKQERVIVPSGEDNTAVKARTKAFVDECLPLYAQHKFVALVSHKGWLREIRHTLMDYVNDGSLQVDFDVDQWDQTLYQNSEVRVAEFHWKVEDDDDDTNNKQTKKQKLYSIVSRSVSNTIHSIRSKKKLKHDVSKNVQRATCADASILKT